MRLVRSRHRAVAYLVAVAVAASSLVAPGSAAPAQPGGGTVAVPALTRDTFADPPTSVRPKYRWWMPLAHTDDQQLARELAQMKQAGAGGAEVAAFLSEGPGYRTNPFLSTYGWGTPLWTDKVETMLSAAKDTGLNLDFTIGPRWPATVPTVADVNHPAAAQKIVFSREFRAGGTRRTGKLPTNFDTAPPAGANRTLIAALIAKCSDPGCASQPSPKLLDQASVIDVTAQVAADGTLDIVYPGEAASTYALIAFYQTPNGGNLNGYTATVTNYALDTLSPAGAQAVIDFYEDSILTPDVRALLEQLATTELFEDSLELGAQKWTSNFVAEWTQRRGYSPITLLPALAGAGAQGGLPGRFPGQPFFDFAGGVGDRVRTDYRQTLSDLYIAYRLDVLRAWAHEHHMKTRAQPYGEAIDAAEAAGHIDVPEGESLAFGRQDSAYSNVQNYKVVAAGAHLSGAPVVSDECCAFRGSVWGSTVGDASDTSNLQAVYRGYAGGVNQLVWHGFPYLSRGPAGSAAQSIWPGMSYGGNDSYSEAFGAKGGPNWADYRQVNDHLARMQLVLRQGKPRFDLAVYWQDFGIGLTGTSANKLIPDSSALASAGYTYEYLSPAHLRGPDATVRDGVLFPDASAYRALLLNNQTTMPLDAAHAILRVARQGLPVVVLGEAPTSTPGYQPGQDAELRAVVAELLRQPGVVRVDSEAAVPDALLWAGVRAAAAHSTPSDAILDVRRHAGGVDYYYLFNQSAATTYQTLTLTGEGSPYHLDTWTGQVTPIAGHTAGRGTVTLPVRLAGHDAMVIAVTARRDATFHGPATPHTPIPEAGQGIAAPQPVRLTDWSLTVDSWTPGPSGLPGDTAHTTVGPVTVTANPDRTLPAWSQLGDALADLSGVGTYTTRVRLGPDWSPVHTAYLDLGTVVDTVKVNINGRDLPPVNPMDLGRVDVSTYLRPGDNTITVRVASTLRNAVRVAPGTGAASQPRMDYGLLGPVTITPHAAANTQLLTVEPTQRLLPLASGGYTEAEMLVTNNSNRAAQVSIDAAGPTGITASEVPTTVPAGGSATIPVSMRNTGKDSGTSVVAVTARTDNGLTATTQQWLNHSNNLALNTEGARYPRLVTETAQDRFPAELAVDGNPSTYYSSWGKSAGQGPTAHNPAMFGFDFGAPISVGSVSVGGQVDAGARTFTIEASNDGGSWRTVTTVSDHPVAGGTVSFGQITARYLRLRITDTWDTVRPNRHVEIGEVAVTS